MAPIVSIRLLLEQSQARTPNAPREERDEDVRARAYATDDLRKHAHVAMQDSACTAMISVAIAECPVSERWRAVLVYLRCVK
jgi:hypothetical protein